MPPRSGYGVPIIKFKIKSIDMKTIQESGNNALLLIALEKYPIMLTTLSASEEIDMYASYRKAFIEGYEEALSRLPTEDQIWKAGESKYILREQGFEEGANFVIDKLKTL